MFDSSLIKEEHRRDFAKLVKEDAAFFKHADTDPNATRDFNPLANDMFISMSVTGLLLMNEQMHDLELAFNFWGVVNNPRHYAEHIIKYGIPIDDLKKWQSLNKPRFL